MMGCNCTPSVITPTTTCKDCLILSTYRYGCADGPKPCGDTLVLNLAEKNVTDASPCPVVYSIKSYDKKAFSSVSVTDAGVLTVVTSNEYKKSEEFYIEYKVNSPCSILSSSAFVYVCMKDLCIDKVCSDGCDPCTGNCIALDPEILIASSAEIGLS